MSIIEFIILAIAISLEGLIVMHSCATQTRISLSKGLAESIVFAAVQSIMIAIGMLLGDLLHFRPANGSSDNAITMLWNDTNNLVYLGLMLIVAIRLLFRSGKKGRQVPPYDISRISTALLLGLAIGINTLIIGIAIGFRLSFADNVWRATIPLFVMLSLFSYLGIMIGRQQRPLRARRYTLFAVLFLLAFALKGAFWS